MSSSIEALRAGAWDYLPKPFSATHLQVLIGRASHAVMVTRETKALRQQLVQQNGNSDKITLLGVAPAFRKAVELARKVAPTDASVMITGESGTGKEVIAQFIHHHSRRASRKLVPINCAALPEPLLESEMFGHRKGAFTGADRDKPGLLETANGGTLFLDELTRDVASDPGEAAARAAGWRRAPRRQRAAGCDGGRALRLRDESRSAGGGERGDSARRSLLPAARGADQAAAASPAAGGHRAARESLSDVLLGARTARPGDTLPKLTENSMEFLRTRQWRGNVRELQNVIEHVAVLAEPGQPIQPQDIPAYEDGNSSPARTTMSGAIMDEPYHAAKDRLIAEFEREYLARLSARAGGNMSRAARLANIDRTTLYRLMEKHNVRRDELSGASE